MNLLGCYREVWLVDFEFHSPAGHRPEPLCVVAREFRSGRVVRKWLEGNSPAEPPCPTDAAALFVAYYASAELSCHLALGWPMPTRILDLYAEFRNHTNGRSLAHGSGLLGALAFFGLDALGAVEKEQMRELAMRGPPFTPEERESLLDYCQTDVDSLARLLPRMIPHLDLPRALLRGRFMKAVAMMEWNGTPIDRETLDRLGGNWAGIKTQLVRELDRDYRVFVPTGRRLDPATRFGSIVLDVAREMGINPHELADAAEDEYRAQKQAVVERLQAIRAARKATGLTLARMEKLLNAGKDYPDVSGLDVQSRELAGMYPELGIGGGYGSGEANENNVSRLWELLSKPDPVLLPRHHPDLIRRAAERVGTEAGYSLPAGPLTFSAALWADYLVRKRIPWPRLPSGALALDDGTFREMAKAYPAEVGPMRELRHILGQLRLNELAVGPDGRNRAMLSAFRSRTGRNQPSNSRFIFGPSCWLRSLVKPGPGRALAYVDWSQQELGIAAALSADPRMMEAYQSGDFYLTFAKMAGAVPISATKQTHGRERDQFKTVALGVLYGLTKEGLARKLAVLTCRGRELLELHQRTFSRFWEWSNAIEERAILTGALRTVFGWRVLVARDVNPRSLRNFPMQGNGAEMMRLAACLATERGIAVCCPVHDAFLIEAGIDEIEDETERMRDAMREASEAVLPGFPLKTDAKIVRHPDRYADPRGEQTWTVVWQILAELEAEGTGFIDDDPIPL